jgi:predicted dehydrogenase
VNYVPYGDVYFNSWYRDHAVTGGLFLQKATHDFDYLAHLVGSPITGVAAMAMHGRVFQDAARKSGAGEADVAYFPGIGTPETGMNEDCSSALLSFANGVHGVYTQNFFARHGAAARGATISGQRATIQFDWYTNRIRRDWHHEKREETVTVDGADGHGGGDGALARNLIAVVREGKPSITPLRAGLASAYACLAARESAQEGRFVAVRQWGGADVPLSARAGAAS